MDVNFNNQRRLAGLRFSGSNGQVTLALKWRCLRSVFWPLRCFAHILDADGQHIGSLDHDLLDGNPPAPAWRPGDDGYEFRYVNLDLASLSKSGASVEAGSAGAHSGPAAYCLRIGLFNPSTNLRLPLVASTLPVTDECTAAMASASAVPGTDYVFRLEPSAVTLCKAVFGDAMELMGYSVTRADGFLWLRLRWRLLKLVKADLLFFGHAVPARDPEIGALAWFDQEMGLQGRGTWPRFEQDIVRALPCNGREPARLRAGVCTLPGLERLEIRESSFDYDAAARCLFIPLDR